MDQNPVDFCMKNFYAPPPPPTNIPPTNPEFQMDGEKLLPDAQNTTTLYGLRLFIPNLFWAPTPLSFGWWSILIHQKHVLWSCKHDRILIYVFYKLKSYEVGGGDFMDYL